MLCILYNDVKQSTCYFDRLAPKQQRAPCVLQYHVHTVRSSLRAELEEGCVIKPEEAIFCLQHGPEPALGLQDSSLSVLKHAGILGICQVRKQLHTHR